MAAIIPRRDFLKIAALASAALSLRPSFAFSRQLKRRGPAKKIIVVGAGLAGLSAAYELTQAGLELRALVAQLGPCGGVWTPPARFSYGLCSEGASLHNTHTH